MSTDKDSERLARIEEHLELLVRLLALQVSPDSEPMIDRAVRLQKAGLQPKEIAQLCNSTPNAVSVALAKAKRQRKKGTARR
jgi:hypothetical protein